MIDIEILKLRIDDLFDRYQKALDLKFHVKNLIARVLKLEKKTNESISLWR